LIELRSGHRVACHYATEIASGALKPKTVETDLDWSAGTPKGNRAVGRQDRQYVELPINPMPDGGGT